MALITPGHVILVTGATGGIGGEIAAMAAEQGAIVAVHGSRAETVAAAMERIRERAPNAQLIAAPGDFREPGVIEAVVNRAASEGGRLDAVIHSAITGAPGVSGVFVKLEPRNFGLAAANVLGVFQQLCFAAMPHLAKEGGTIVAFASDAGRFAAPRQSVMGGIFGGIMMFVRNLSMEAARDKVRVHCISPSFVIDTPVFEAFAGVGDRGVRARERAPLDLPSPKDIAPITLFLCGPGATKITGQIISINGGLHA
jgi:3-oxoacyl-[acyl-carrier protein] reductase